MATTADEISSWFDYGIKQKATHMIVVCDDFSHEDYPVYVMPDQNVRKIQSEYDGKNMQYIMEVYNLKMDKAVQLAQSRVFNY